MLRIPLPWLAIIALLVLAFILWEKSPSVLTTPPQTEAGEFPYAFMTDIETLEYDNEGKLRYRMITLAAKHYQTDLNKAGPKDYTLIEEPQLAFYSENDSAPWHLSAMEGRSDNNGERITLRTNVLAEQQSTSQGLIQATTSKLSIKIAEQYAETDKAVKMRAQQGEIETVGMQAFLNEDRIELLSQVRGTYAP
jgi:lipopolysaccharide export system protein LptC